MQKDQTPVYHLVQARLWNSVLEAGSTYYPPTYEVDGFIHATANPNRLLDVANHFYRNVPGEWYCLQMTVQSIAGTGVETVFEATAPVGDIQPEFDGAGDELFPHIFGGLRPAAVLRVFPVTRSADGAFLTIKGVTD